MPNDHSLYPCATRCCKCCCVCPAFGFVKDSHLAKAQLLEAMRKCEERKKTMKGIKGVAQVTSEEMSRA